MGKISLKEMNDHKAEKEESIEKIETVQKHFNHDGGFRNDDTSEHDMGKKEFVEFIKKVNEENKGVWAYVRFKNEDTLDVDLQSDRIENESSTYHLHRTSIKAAKRDVENFVKWHEVAIREEESGLEFRNSLYESLSTLEHEYVLINGKAKYGGEWLSKISNSKNGDEVLGKSVEVYRRVDDGYTRVFEIEPKEVLQTSKHQAVKRDVEER